MLCLHKEVAGGSEGGASALPIGCNPAAAPPLPAAGSASTSTAPGALSGSEAWAKVRALVAAVPRDLLAAAASRAGAHARALQYYESHVRALRGGGHNPAARRSAEFEDEEVSFLQVRAALRCACCAVARCGVISFVAFPCRGRSFLAP